MTQKKVMVNQTFLFRVLRKETATRSQKKVTTPERTQLMKLNAWHMLFKVGKI